MANMLSVTMANYNHGQYVGRALENILSQSVRPLEVIVIDDGSKDNSVEIIEEFVKKDPIVRLLRNEKNMGLMYCTQKLMNLVRGDYIYGAGADDRVLPGLFEKSMDLLTKYPQAGICSSLTRYMNQDGIDMGIHRIPWVSEIACYLSPQQVRGVIEKWYPFFMGNTCIFRRDALDEVGGFLEELGPACDAFAMLTIALKYGACFIPEPLACLQVTASSFNQARKYDIEYMTGIRQRTVHLMENSYTEVFPEKIVRLFERHALYGLGVNICEELERYHQTTCTKIEMLLCERTNLNFSDRISLTGLRCLMWSTKSVIEKFLQFKYLFGWSWINRKLRRIFDR